VKIRRGSWNEELFRVLEGFPDLAHDDEVDACSGALELLNPQMSSWGLYELMRRKAQELKQQSEPEPRKAQWAPGSAEWQAEQEAKRTAQIEAAAVEGTAGSSPSGPHSETP
jgi:hypothetical protein